MAYDVAVYGGTAAGVVAAVAAARAGARTILIHSHRHLGGMTSGGLGATDMGNPETIGGMARELYRRIGAVRGVGEIWRFEPHVAEQVLEDWLAEAGVEVRRETVLTGVGKTGSRISGLAVSAGAGVAANVFVDATYEGDLLAAAGVPYHVGREASAEFGESLAGVRNGDGRSRSNVPVSPFLVPGDPASGLLPGISPGDGGVPGSADHCVQAYCYRLCMTQDEDNVLPMAPPAAYDPLRYEILARWIRARLDAGKSVKLSSMFLMVRMARGKTDVNNSGPLSTDFVGASRAYPEATWPQRDRIARAHEDYIRGLFHFLREDPRVPPYVRREAASWGLCRDEFTDTGGWPHQLYVREARRMRGLYVMTQADCQGKTSLDDGIAMGSYPIDCHACQRLADGDDVVREGGMNTDVAPYPVAYRSLCPRPADAVNLLVPVCLSASHVAIGSIRMEPVYMALGHAAGMAAARAAAAGKDVQAVDVPALREELRQQGQVLAWDQAASRWHGEWAHDPFVVQSYQWWLD